jgi:hypothetical protein
MTLDSVVAGAQGRHPICEEELPNEDGNELIVEARR